MSHCVSVGDYTFMRSGISELVSDTLISAGEGAFKTSRLQNIVLPNLVTIQQQIFSGCELLREIILQKVNYLPGEAFYYCPNLKKVSIPLLNLLDKFGGQFAYCSCLSADELDLGEFSGIIPCRTFSYSGVKRFDNPYITEIMSDAFRGSSVKYVRLKECSVIGLDAFKDCSDLKEVYMPSLTAVKSSPFIGCALETVFAPQLTEFLPEMFATSEDPSTCRPVTLFLNSSISVNSSEMMETDAELYNQYPYTVYTAEDSATDAVCELFGWERVDINTIIVPQYAAVVDDLVYFIFRFYGIPGVSKYVYEDKYGINVKGPIGIDNTYGPYFIDEFGEDTYFIHNKKTHNTDFCFCVSSSLVHHMFRLYFTAIIDFDGMEFRSVRYSTSLSEAEQNELFPDCDHQFEVYNFKDGVVNVKDYVLLSKEYNQYN